ncbi:MAG TPA: DUF2934 domain-containing protein [Burkholderiales bacterium]|nr:DUF2934 domain-containing protein [Burkholderiales bacterium]
MSAQISDSSKRRQKTDEKLELQAKNNLVADRDRQIAEAAYFIAERRGFEQGHELEDWLRAEAEVNGRQQTTFQ